MSTVAKKRLGKKVSRNGAGSRPNEPSRAAPSPADELAPIKRAMLAWFAKYSDTTLREIAGIVGELELLVGSPEFWRPGTPSRADLLHEVCGKLHFIRTGKQRPKRGSYAVPAERFRDYLISSIRGGVPWNDAAALATGANVFWIILSREPRTFLPNAPAESQDRLALFEKVAKRVVLSHDQPSVLFFEELICAWAKACGFQRPSKLFDMSKKRESKKLLSE